MKSLAAGEDWVAIEADADASDVAAVTRLAAETLGRAAAELDAVGVHDPEVRGIRLFAVAGGAHARLSAALVEAPAALEFRAITRPPLWPDGRFDEPFAGESAVTLFHVRESRGDAVEFELVSEGANAKAVRFHLARAGMPAAGDLRRGGAEVSGGLRLRAAALKLDSEGIDVSAPEPADWWPAESLSVPEQPRPTLTVSNASAAALRRGHPWVIPDEDTSDVESLPAGRLVEVRSVRGDLAGLARIDGRGRIAARRWAQTSKRGAVDSVETRVAKALRRRASLRTDPGTNAYRLIHGEADALPGLAIDRFGPLLRVLLSGRACEPILDRILNTLTHQLASELGPEPAILRVVHLAEAPSGRLRGVVLLRGSLDGLLDADGRLEVSERGLRFAVDPGQQNPFKPRAGVGLFLDQRDNRTRVTQLARGGRWLNLFCHTGGFSAAALAGGAREVVSVDLSAQYLTWLEANLARNGLAGARHRSVRGDARRHLERLSHEERFDGIVLDPPTAAAAGRRFWSVRQDGGELIRASLAHLVPGGRLLVCRNDHQARGTVEALIEEVAKQHGFTLEALEPAPPGRDFPDLEGFPEGRAFEGALATLR